MFDLISDGMDKEGLYMFHITISVDFIDGNITKDFQHRKILGCRFYV